MHNKKITPILAFLASILFCLQTTHAVEVVTNGTPTLSLLLFSNKDCNGLKNGPSTIDDCGVCDDIPANDNTTCTQDCNGDWRGTAFIDNCSTCVAGNTGKSACTQDCNGDWGGTAFIDNCSSCVGGNTGLQACTPTCAPQGINATETMMWQGKEWQRCNPDNTFNWYEAMEYCENLVIGGSTEWRVPTKDELKSLVVCSNGHPVPLDDHVNCGADGYGFDTLNSPTIDDGFHSTFSYNWKYWTSTTLTTDEEKACSVAFAYGNAGCYLLKADDYASGGDGVNVRCIKDM